MAEQDYITRAEVQQMIAEALKGSDSPGAGGQSKDGKVVQRFTLLNEPSGYFRSPEQMQGAVMPTKIATDAAHDKSEKKAQQPSGVLGGGERVTDREMGGMIRDPDRTINGGYRDSTGVMAGDIRKGPTGSRSKEAQSKPASLSLPVPAASSPAVPPPALIDPGTAVYIEQQVAKVVTEKINAAVPPQIRSMGCAPMTNPGKYLRLQGNDSQTAVWGSLDMDEIGNPFSGNVWVANYPKLVIDVSEVGATQFLGIYLDGSGHYWASSMPSAQPADSVVFDLNQVSGDIHIFGNIGGE